MVRKLKPVHPGEVLVSEFLAPQGLSPNRLARAAGLSGSRAYALVRGELNITARMALRLSLALGTTPEFWMNLQNHYDLELARTDPRSLER